MTDNEELLPLDLGVITADMIRRYSMAVGEVSPVHFDRAAAISAGYDDIVAPPNFLSAIIGTPCGILEGDLLEDGLDPSDIPAPLQGLRVMGGGQQLAFSGPVYPGTHIICRRTMLGVERKQTKSGDLLIARTEARYYDEHGSLLLTCVQTMLGTS